MKFTSSLGLTLLGLAEAYPGILAKIEQSVAKRIDGPNLNKRVPFNAAAVGHRPSSRTKLVTDKAIAIGQCDR